ncbi:MAG TPA: hypothetical protein VNY24_22215 [Candidatus Acidoferrales bacterium]|nr:hypothetical protein [Candidatus Acidoferrales bacterium]
MSNRSAGRLQLVLGFWIVAAQLWYFYQFVPAMGSLLRAISHRIWR